jgi:hypothetical protein
MTVPRERACAPGTGPGRLRKPHNVARKVFVTEMLSALAAAEAAALDRPLDPEDLPLPGPGCGTSRRSGPRSTRCGRS